MVDLDRWQRPDGFPSYEYFQAVVDALGEAGVAVAGWERDEAWDVSIKLAPQAYENGPLGWAEHGLYVLWRTDESDEPKHADDFTGMGWYWVPYSKPQTALGDYARQFAGLPYLPEPIEVAAAVADLVGAGRKVG